MFAPLLDIPSHRLIPSYCLNSRVILECESSKEVGCSCHAAPASTILLSLHDLPKFVTRWCEWVREEIRHILGVVAHTAEWSLIMKSAGDDWEELRLSTSCDAPFGTRFFGGYKVKLTGSRGSSFLIEVGKSPARTSKHEFDTVRVDWMGTSSQSGAASQGSSGCMSFETSSF